MAYVKTTWVAGVTPLSAANLNHLEEQYDDADAELSTHEVLNTGVHGIGGSTFATAATLATHAALTATHGVGGTIADVAQIAATKLDDFATPDDNTDLDSSTTEHGLLRKLDNVATNFLNGQGGWAVPPGQAALTIAETEAFASAAAPTSWTDLDLSAIVGSNVALVMLKVSQSSTASCTMAFRKNGDTEEHFPGADLNMGAGAADVKQSAFAIIMVITDSSGIIEWRAQSGATSTVDVIAYVK